MFWFPILWFTGLWFVGFWTSIFIPHLGQNFAPSAICVPQLLQYISFPPLTRTVFYYSFIISDDWFSSLFSSILFISPWQGIIPCHPLYTKNAPHSSFTDGICVSRQIKCRDFGSAKTTQSRLLYPTLYKLYYSQIYIVFLPRTPSYSFCLLRRDLGCRGLSPANPLPGFAGFGGKDK